jgi:8-oxo-dGTP pyrophosphatase MutT (NUDIX family)
MERSAGAVIFHENKEREYLLLHYESGHWDYVKGHIENNESEKEALIRETEEEAGIKKDDIRIIENFKEKIQYFYKHEGKLIKKEVVFYLAKSKTKAVKISKEHIGYKWLPYEEALKQLTFKNAKDILKKANNFLKQRLI